MNAKYIGFDIDSKKNDRIDARKQAVLLGIGEVPPVHIPRGGPHGGGDRFDGRPDSEGILSEKVPPVPSIAGEGVK